MFYHASKMEFTSQDVCEIMNISPDTLKEKTKSGAIAPFKKLSGSTSLFSKEALANDPQANYYFTHTWDDEVASISRKGYTSLELFAGAGGLAIGMENAGFKHILLNEFDKHACNTLKQNRPGWNVIQGDVTDLCFKQYRGLVDVLSGGFPCQAFSYSGERRGFEDVRGTLFFQLARAVDEVQPKVLIAENVKGLIKHDGGKTLATIRSVIKELGYTLVEPKLLKAKYYKVPQKRERLFLVAIRNDLVNTQIEDMFFWPSPYKRVMLLSDALKKGEIFNSDVPLSPGQLYPPAKKEVMDMVPQGGCWRDLPLDIQKSYMKGSFELGGGKTGMARRLSWDEPSLTLTCAPAQKQTERCHPDETRPLQVREYARIQTFPDDWVFSGPVSAQYKQIGNAVPVNLGFSVARQVSSLLDRLG